MSKARVAAARIRGLFRRGRMDRELEEEIRFHLQMRAEENLSAGMNAEEAAREARRSFGGVEAMKEEHRQTRTIAWLEEAVRDGRFALRTLWRAPAFTLASVATLALAIGASTAMFHVIDEKLLRPLPYPEPDRLVMMWSEVPSQGLREGRPTFRDVEQWSAAGSSIESMAVIDQASVTLAGAEGAEKISSLRVSPNLFSILGIRPALGRAFTAREALEQQRLVMISHSFWQARFGGSHRAIGSALDIDGIPSRIVGVLPAALEFDRDAAVWEPHTMAPRWRDQATWMVVARLRAAVSVAQAQAEMGAIARRLDEQAPPERRGRGVTLMPMSVHVTGARTRSTLWMLAAAVLAVMLLAAANVASLSLARGVARARELALRSALGASAGRIARQLIAESLALSAMSGALGAALVVLLGLPLDARALGWALAVSLVTGALVGAGPALTMRSGSLRPSRAAHSIRRALVAAEFAIAVMLLAAAGLLLQSWQRLAGVEPGFRPERALTLQISTTGFQASARAGFYQRVIDAVSALPGVEGAAIASEFFTGGSPERTVTTERESIRFRFRSDEASPGFFRVAGTRLLTGRFFSSEDREGAAPVAILNDAMARRLWPEGGAVGRRFRPAPSAPWITVIGVTGNMRRQGIESDPAPQMFVPLAQDPPRLATLLVRTSADPLAMAAAVESAVRSVDRTAPVYGAATLESRMASHLAQRRLQTSLVTGFSAVALLMAAIGIYGLIQYSITARTREIGIRLAIGARPAEIFSMILREGLSLCVLGLAVGLTAALWIGRAASGLLFGITGTDPVTFAAAGAVLLAVAAVACCQPARRAMRVDPATALRQE